MNIIRIIINFKGGLHVPGKLNQRSGLEHGRQRAGRRIPGGIPGDFNIAVPQDHFRAEQQRPCRDMVIAGNDCQLFHLRIPFLQDVQGKDGILGRCQGMILHNDPGRIHSLRFQPFGHPPRFGGSRIISRRPAARAYDQRLRILFGCRKQHLQPFNQFFPHGTIRIQLKTQCHQAQ